MKESNILVSNAACNSLIREILLDTKEQYMKESNSPVGNAPIKQLQRQVSLYTIGQCMTESNTLVGNVTNNIPRRNILQDTTDPYIKANKH